MKKTIILMVFVMMAIPAISQDENENKPISKHETLIGPDEMTLGIYGGPEFKFTNINGELGFMSGGRGGIVIGRVFTIGGAGYGLSTFHKVKFSEAVAYNLETGWGGLFMEYVNQPNKLIHFSINTLIGGGKASYRNRTFIKDEWDDVDIARSGFFLFEPGANIEFNLASFLRLSIGGSYRVVAGLDMAGLKNNDLGGYSINAGLKFGLDDFNVLGKAIEDIKKTINK